MSIPQLRGPVDHMRHGFNSMQTEVLQQHPVEAIQNDTSAWHNKLSDVSRQYGSHLAMRLATERATFSRPHRLPGLASSSVAFETLNGSDTSITFADYLGAPSQRAEQSKYSIHHQMEIRLGLL